MSEPNAESIAEPSHERVVLITGAARRLGREIALVFARAGWRVAVHFRHSEQDAQQTAQDCHQYWQAAHATGTTASVRGAAIFQAELGDETQTRALLPQVVAGMGRVDAVVNSASLFEFDDVQSFSYAQMQRHICTNTAAAIVLAQALHAHLSARACEGAVINLLDQKLWNQNADFMSYTLSKAALEAANTMLALALAPHVRVVGVAPGLTLTSDWLTPEQFEKLHQLSPLKRSSTPHDVAHAVLFAATNTSMTGTTLLVDGGQHLQRFERDFSMMEPKSC
jgi:NAD(P)-dependent dehydrogenase (short-subunit alcohol dehydrogenase family)